MEPSQTAIPILHVDAFAEKAFEGNPAAVCLLTEELPESWMQSVAAELNLPATAFVWPADDGYELRWFTPTGEIMLCGHGTLASAHVMWMDKLISPGDAIRFQTKGGTLICKNAGEIIELNFPSTAPSETKPEPVLLEALRVRPSYVGKSKFDYLLAVDSEQIVRALEPDFQALRSIQGIRGVIVTSTSQDPRFDFVSRFFAPRIGIDEDSVTGSAHCSLAPFWSKRLGKTAMTAFQASKRGGVVHVRSEDDRVVLGGRAVTIFRGELSTHLYR